MNRANNLKKSAFLLLSVVLLNSSFVSASERNVSALNLRGDMLNRKESISYSMNRENIEYVTGLSSDVIPYMDEAFSYPDNDGTCGDYLAFSVREASVSGSYSSDGKGKLNYKFTYMTTYEQEAELSALASSVSSQIEGKSDFEKAKYIHDYICEHANYDTSYSKFDAYNLLFNHSAVCEGYALGFYRLAKAAKLDCRIVTGKASGDRVVNGFIQEGNQSTGDNHAWNIVKIDGQWYNVDVTWDDQNKISYDYFLKNEADFSPEGATHERNAKYADINVAQVSVDMNNPPSGSTPYENQEITDQTSENEAANNADKSKVENKDKSSNIFETIGKTIAKVVNSVIEFINSIFG